MSLHQMKGVTMMVTLSSPHQNFKWGYVSKGKTRLIPTLSLQKTDIQTISGDRKQHKPVLQGSFNILIL